MASDDDGTIRKCRWQWQLKMKALDGNGITVDDDVHHSANNRVELRDYLLLDQQSNVIVVFRARCLLPI
jgi:hypothetical protein